MEIKLATKGVAATALETLNQRFAANPFNQRERIVPVGEECGLIEISIFNGRLRLHSIRVSRAGSGIGRAVLKEILAAADEAGASIELHAKPFGEAHLNQSQLIAWYRRHGFRKECGSELVRLPQ